jgi:hypothetical protein
MPEPEAAKSETKPGKQGHDRDAQRFPSFSSISLAAPSLASDNQP